MLGLACGPQGRYQWSAVHRLRTVAIEYRTPCLCAPFEHRPIGPTSLAGEPVDQLLISLCFGGIGPMSTAPLLWLSLTAYT